MVVRYGWRNRSLEKLYLPYCSISRRWKPLGTPRPSPSRSRRSRSRSEIPPVSPKPGVAGAAMRRSSGQLSTGPRCRRKVVILAFPLLLLASFTPVSFAQAADDAAAVEQQRVLAIETKLNELNDTLSQTEKMLEK